MDTIPTWKMILMIFGAIIVFPIAYFHQRKYNAEMKKTDDLQTYLFRQMFERNEPKRHKSK